MSKFDPLWKWINDNNSDEIKLSFTEIEKICGIPMDHSFLTFKKELTGYGYKVKKISMKDQTVIFEKLS